MSGWRQERLDMVQNEQSDATQQGGECEGATRVWTWRLPINDEQYVCVGSGPRAGGYQRQWKAQSLTRITIESWTYFLPHSVAAQRPRNTTSTIPVVKTILVGIGNLTKSELAKAAAKATVANLSQMVAIYFLRPLSSIILSISHWRENVNK